METVRHNIVGILNSFHVLLFLSCFCRLQRHLSVMLYIICSLLFPFIYCLVYMKFYAERPEEVALDKIVERLVLRQLLEKG